VATCGSDSESGHNGFREVTCPRFYDDFIQRWGRLGCQELSSLEAERDCVRSTYVSHNQSIATPKITP